MTDQEETELRSTVKATHDTVIKMDTYLRNEITHVKADVQGHKDTLYATDTGLIYQVSRLNSLRKDVKTMTAAAWGLGVVIFGAVLTWILKFH